MLRGRNNPEPDCEDDGGSIDGDGPSRWTKAGTVCAVIFGAIMLSSVGIIAWDKTLGDDEPAQGNPPALSALPSNTLPSNTLPSSTSVPARCRVTAQRPAKPCSTPGTDITGTTPASVTWLQVGYGALPFSGAAGPAAIRNGVPSGFAHTLAGAVQAAIQILGRLSWSAQTKASMQAVVTASTTPAAQAQVVLTYGPPSDPSVIPQVAGFQVVTYSSTQAVVNLALRFNGALRVSPATMQWVSSGTGAGDWKLAGAPGPLSETNWAQVQDLTGYTLFSGQPTKAGD